MRNERGQALVEFIVIFPVFVFLIIGMLDFGNILYQKYQLENEIDFISDLYQNGKTDTIQTYSRSKQISVQYQPVDSGTVITVKKKVPLSTPGVNNVLPNPYVVSVKRVIYEG